jgi:hypothetical protein
MAKLIYLLVDREYNNGGREDVLAIFTNYKRAMKEHSKRGKQEHYFYGLHVDVRGVDGDKTYECCIDEPTYNHATKRRDGPMWQPPTKKVKT